MAPWRRIGQPARGDDDVTVLASFPTVHFDHGAIGELAGELGSRAIRRPLVITDSRPVEHGIVDKLRAALPGNPDIAVFGGIPPNPTVAGIEGAPAVYANAAATASPGSGTRARIWTRWRTTP
jgi:alcohol dehydrogenase class IV